MRAAVAVAGASPAAAPGESPAPGESLAASQSLAASESRAASESPALGESLAASGSLAAGQSPAASVEPATVRPADVRAVGGARAETHRLHAAALALLDRHGIVTRAAVAAEGTGGGFAAVYPVLRALEDAGRVRRGYFIDGLGAAQFALPGAVDRLRAVREPRTDEPVAFLLAAADPANPYGASVPWPRRPDDDERRLLPRSAGAYVATVEGEPVVYVERGGRGLVTLPAFDDPAAAAAGLAALAALISDGRVRELVVARVDGVPIADTPHRAALLGAGFVPAYRGLALRRPPGSTVAVRRDGLHAR